MLIAAEGSPERFKADTYLMLNATGKKIMGKLNDQQFAVQSGSHELIQPEGQGEILNVALFFNDRHGDAVPFANNAWRRNPRVKSIVIFHMDSNKRLRRQTLRIFPD